MTAEDFTPRNVAKFVVSSAITLKSTELAKNALTDYTSLAEDSKTVNIGSKVIGGFIGSKLKPYSDKAVDKTADFVVTKREARKAKKAAKQED